MGTPAKGRLHKLYVEKLAVYSEMAAKRNRGECTHLELKEAEAEMETIGVLLVGMEKRR